jgi:hypothetical protein
LAAHLQRYSAQGAELVFTSREDKPINRSHFDPYIWHRAVKAVGVEPGRQNGMHALRHFYASVLIDAGESVKAVAEYLGHADPGYRIARYSSTTITATVGNQSSESSGPPPSNGSASEMAARESANSSARSPIVMRRRMALPSSLSRGSPARRWRRNSASSSSPLVTSPL